MGFFEVLGILVFLYFLIQIILWIILDCDIELFISEKFGVPISSLRGKVVWITGASSGIGKHLAIILAKNDVKLCLSARREDELEKVKKECLSMSSSLSSDDILVLKMDMLEIDKHEEYFEKVLQHFNGQLDVLVNNAGRSQRANWECIDIRVDRELFELDVFSVINLSRIYVRHLNKTKQKGHLAVTSSGAGITYVPMSASYVGAKHAINAYFGCLKIEKPNIDITIFCPGATATNFLQEAFTHEQGISFGQSVGTENRMTGERCGFLMATAIANKLNLNFAGVFPTSLLLYISSCYPNVRKLVLYALGEKGLKRIRDPELKKQK